MNEKTCSNCLFEYTCDWTPAVGEDTCEGWTEDKESENGTLNE